MCGCKIFGTLHCGKIQDGRHLIREFGIQYMKLSSILQNCVENHFRQCAYRKPRWRSLDKQHDHQRAMTVVNHRYARYVCFIINKCKPRVQSEGTQNGCNRATTVI